MMLKAEVKNSKIEGKGVFARKNIKKGETIIKIEGPITRYPNKYALQIDEDKYIGCSGKVCDFTNHSCEPNCYISFNSLHLVALGNIKKGEELTFNYCITEKDLTDGYEFKCECGAKKCLARIKGFDHLSLKEKLKLMKFLSPFLKKKFEEEINSINSSI